MSASYSTASEVDLKIPMCTSTNVKRRNKKLYLSIIPPLSKKVRIDKKDISREIASIDICLSVPSNMEHEAAELARYSRQSGITVEYFAFYHTASVKTHRL